MSNVNDARHAYSGTTTLGNTKSIKRMGLERFQQETVSRVRTNFLLECSGLDAFNALQKWVIKNPTSLEAAKVRLEAKRNSYKEKVKELEAAIKELPNTYQEDPKVSRAQDVIGKLDAIFMNAEMGVPDVSVLKTTGKELVAQIVALVAEVTKESETESATASTNS